MARDIEERWQSIATEKRCDNHLRTKANDDVRCGGGERINITNADDATYGRQTPPGDGDGNGAARAGRPIDGWAHLLDGRSVPTRSGTLRFSRDGQALRVTCAPCRLRHRDLAAAPVRFRSVALEVRRDGDALCIEALQPLSPVRRNNLLRHWIRRQGGEMPSRELLGLLWQEVALAREDANPRLSLQGLECRRFQGRLHLVPPGLAPREEVLPTRAGETLRLPDGLGTFRLLSSDEGEGLRPPREDEPLSVRFQVAPGVMLKPVGRVGSRRLKKLLQERLQSIQSISVAERLDNLTNQINRLSDAQAEKLNEQAGTRSFLLDAKQQAEHLT